MLGGGGCPRGVLSQRGLSQWGFVLEGFCPRGVLSQWGFVLEGFCPIGVVCPRGFCPRGVLSIYLVTHIKLILTQKRLSRYGQCVKGGDPHNNKQIISMSMAGTRLGGRSNMIWLGRMKSHMSFHAMNPEMATDRERWSVMVKNDKKHGW